MNQPVPIDEIIFALLRSWPVILFIGGVIFNAGATVYMVRDHKKQIAALHIRDELIETDMRNRLYDQRSQPIYMPVDVCTGCRAKCESDRDKEYDYLTGQLSAHGLKLDRVLEAMSAFTQFMRQSGQSV